MLIDTNVCNYLVGKYIREDNKDTCNLSKPSPSLNIVIRKNKPKVELAKCHHTTLFSPVKATLTQAIKIIFLTIWPGLDQEIIARHLPTSVATTKYRTKQER